MVDYKLDPENQAAIEAAISGRWGEAVKLNLQLSKKYQDEVEILNRLAKAYTEVAILSRAKSAYRAALRVDPYNQIAKKNLERLNSLSEKDLARTSGSNVSPELFLEEPGKTKETHLLEAGKIKTVSSLKIGDKLESQTSGGEIWLFHSGKNRVGRVEPEMARLIISAIRIGSKFEFIVKAVDLVKDGIKVEIFVKEVVHSAQLSAPVFLTKDIETSSQAEQSDGLDAHEDTETDSQSTEDETMELEKAGIPMEHGSATDEPFDEEDHDIAKDLPYNGDHSEEQSEGSSKDGDKEDES